MSLPAIPSYRLPGEADLPANRAAWRLDPGRAALLVHDMQRYFVDAFPAGASPVVELLANVCRLRAACAALGMPVVFSAQPGCQTQAQRGLLADFWGPGLGTGAEERIVDELAPHPQDVVLRKWRYSAFRRTRLAELLRERGRDQLVVCAVYAHLGCLLTACDAFMEDVRPFFVADAVADFSPEHHRLAVTYTAERCAVTTTTARLLGALETVP